MFQNPFAPVPSDRAPTDPEQVEDLIDILLRDKVVRYRAEQFARVGFNPRQARRLALDRGVDLHKTREMVEKGCDILVAFDIAS